MTVMRVYDELRDPLSNLPQTLTKNTILAEFKQISNVYYIYIFHHRRKYLSRNIKLTSSMHWIDRSSFIKNEWNRHEV